MISGLGSSRSLAMVAAILRASALVAILIGINVVSRIPVNLGIDNPPSNSEVNYADREEDFTP